MDTTTTKLSPNGTQNGSCHELKTTASHRQNSPTGEDYKSVESPNTCSGSSPSLTARSPFVSSLSEREMLKQPRSVNSTAQVQSMPPQLSTSDRYPLPRDHTLLPHVEQSSNSGENDTLSSRGVLSHQPGSHQSSVNSSGMSMGSSGVTSYGSSSLDPLLSSAPAQPVMYQQPPTSITGYPAISGVNGGRPAAASAVGYYNMDSQAPATHPAKNIGSRLQGQPYFYPQPSQYQQVPHGTMAPAYGGNWQHNERVPPSAVQYQPQHIHSMSQPPSYSTHALHPHSQPQYPAQYYNTGGQSTAVGGASGNYGGYETRTQRYSNPPQFQERPHLPYQQPYPSYTSSSQGSSGVTNYSGSNYGYKYGGHTPSTVPYAPLSVHGRVSGNLSSVSGYNAPQNGDVPGSTPYHPLSNVSSSSSSSSARPVDIVPHAGYRRNQSPTDPQRPRSSSSPPQGQPLSHTQRVMQLQPKPPAHFSSMSSISTLSSAGESLPRLQAEHRYQVTYPTSSGGEIRSQYGAGGASEELLISPLQKLDLKTHTRSDVPKSGFPPKRYQPAAAEIQESQPHPSYSSCNDDDSESTASSFLSERLSRREEFDDKTQFLGDPSVEILEHPRDCQVARNGHVELRCRARLINSKLQEQPNYQWYKDDEPLIGEISSECVLEGVGEGEEGRYFCLVSHPNGRSSKQTQAAVVSIRTGNDARAPVITHQPEAYVEVVKGEPLVLTIETEGEPPINYKWFKGAQELKYCRESVLRVPSASGLDNGQYCCTVSNEYGSVLSDVMLVKVVLQRTLPPPVTQFSPSRKRYSSNPDDDIPSDLMLRQFALPVAQQTKNWARLALYLGLLPGDAAQYHQARKEEKAYHLLREWRDGKQGTLYALKTILSQAGVSLDERSMQSSTHSISSSSSSSLSSSQPASLSISSQPRDVVVVYGQEARLEVRTERAEQSTAYQWFKNSQKLTGKTNKQLVIASTIDSDEGSYQCQISTSEGSVMSHPATIKVVSVAPQSQQHLEPTPAGNRSSDSKERPRHLFHRNSGTTVYGLTGRGVDDDNCDEYKSSTVRATVVPPPAPPKGMDNLQIVQHPQSQVVPAGSTVTLSCRASVGDRSKEEVTYVWYMNGLSLPEDTAPDYQITNTTEEDEGMYWCEVSYMTHSLTSQVATVSLQK